MKELSVSLIIPAHNEEGRIGKCLQAVFDNAPHKFLEIIVVDNASTDRTSEIASSFPGVKVIYEGTKGVMHARDRGWRECRGDLVAFLDADCKLRSSWYDRVIKRFTDEPNLALLSGPYLYYDVSKSRRKIAALGFVLVSILGKLVGYVALFGNMVMRRSILEQMSGLDTTIAFYGDDTDTARRAKAFGKVAWDRKLIVDSSGRRFEKQGIIKTCSLYMLNFFSEVFLHRPLTKKYVTIK
ncbi:MAG: glycosyltransferase family A protein [Candidatus Paceibacterota bacterium]|jgi:glycosyltransferase involved in cell wall biosynthesis